MPCQDTPMMKASPPDKGDLGGFRVSGGGLGGVARRLIMPVQYKTLSRC